MLILDTFRWHLTEVKILYKFIDLFLYTFIYLQKLFLGGMSL